MDLITFLRDFGKLFNLNTMISKDQIANRLSTGISYTEASYQILQAIDFGYLRKKHDISLQIGGQDQWGNIVAGLELIRKSQGPNVKSYGLTIPLITKSDGTKFGKSEQGSIWLDKKKTKPYELYQFLFNTSDDNVLKLIKFLTLTEKKELIEFRKSLINNPQERECQNFLADNVVTLIHGEKELGEAKIVSQALFQNDFSNLNKKQIASFSSSLPTTTISEENMNIQEFLVLITAASSKKQARNFLENNSIYINGELITDINF